MADSPEFANGRGLHVHVRTTIKGTYSYVSSVALQIGSDTLEIQAGSHFMNGESTSPSEIGGYALTRSEKCRNKKEVFAGIAPCDLFKIVYRIDLGSEDSAILVKIFKGFVNVELLTPLEDATGMMGSPGTGIKGLVARDGKKVFDDPNEMAAEWQVRDYEPKLFQETRAPQYPEPCILPEKNARRGIRDSTSVATSRNLRSTFTLQRKAASACSTVVGESHESCIFDIVQTGDIEMAEGYLDE